MDPLWTPFGQSLDPLDPIWTLYGPYKDPFRTPCRPPINPLWTCCRAAAWMLACSSSNESGPRARGSRRGADSCACGCVVCERAACVFGGVHVHVHNRRTHTHTGAGSSRSSKRWLRKGCYDYRDPYERSPENPNNPNNPHNDMFNVTLITLTTLPP